MKCKVCDTDGLIGYQMLCRHLLEAHNLTFEQYHYAYIEKGETKKCSGCKHGYKIRNFSARDGR